MKPAEIIQEFAKSGISGALSITKRGSVRLGAAAGLALLLGACGATTPRESIRFADAKSMPPAACLVEFFDVKNDSEGRPVALLSDHAFSNASIIALSMDVASSKHPVAKEVRELLISAQVATEGLNHAPAGSTSYLKAVADIEAVNARLEAMAETIERVYGPAAEEMISECRQKVAEIDREYLRFFVKTTPPDYGVATNPPKSAPKELPTPDVKMESDLDAWFDRRDKAVKAALSTPSVMRP